ncbi:MAG: 2-hydroxychromene-2-carboxylate isomerase [Deltaproteobacteria bacterium]|nr:2-hydroxychromene-2-carboxylate isomerase [Deltaproteobacteria bacterium]
MKKAKWYFDFISPYAYLQNVQLKEFSQNLEIERKPLVFAGILKHWGNKGPVEISSKRVFTYRQIQWIAERRNIPFRFPERHPFNPVPLLRLCLAAGSTREAVDAIFNCVWAQGLAGDQPEKWKIFCEAVSLTEEEANLKISDPDIKTELRTNGEEALEAGVFGVPTMLVDGQLFWGSDSCEMLQDFLENPDLFENSEMKRLENLPGM